MMCLRAGAGGGLSLRLWLSGGTVTRVSLALAVTAQGSKLKVN